MARLGTSGAEIEISTLSTTPDFRSQGVAAATRDTVTFRSGVAAAKCPGTAANSAYVQWPLGRAGVAATNDVTYYARFYFRIDALPSGTVTIGRFGTVAASLITVRLTSGGKIQMFTANDVTQVGSDSVATITTGVWYRIELAYGSLVAGTGLREVRLDGDLVASDNGGTSGSLLDTSLITGWTAAPGVTANMYVDDVALNDSTGTSQTTYPGEGKVVLLKPVSLNANGGSWTDDAAATTSAALFTAVDNTPPLGIADTTAGGGNHQDRNAAANTSLDMNMTDYTTAGVAATDRIRVIVPVINTGAPVVTGAKTGSVGVVSNPTITNIAFVNGATAAANFWQGNAAGTYPTGWKWEKGTTTYDPTVTPGTSPVMRVTITGGTASRIAMVDAMGMYVEYSPRRSLIHNEVRRRNLQKMIGR